MDLINYMEEFEGDQMAYVFSKKKENYRVSIRRNKIKQTLAVNRERVYQLNQTNNEEDKPTLQFLQYMIELSSNTLSNIGSIGASNNNNPIFNNGELNKDYIRSILSLYSNESSVLNDDLNWYKQMIQSFQQINHNEISIQKLEQLKQFISIIVVFEDVTKIEIISLNDILFLTRLMSVNDIQMKLKVIDIFSALYESNKIKQNIIQYFIQYISMGNIEIIEKILDILLDKVQQLDQQLISKLSKQFFQKIIMRLLSLKIENVSINIIKIASILISNNNIPNSFMQSLLQNQNNIFQLLVFHLEFKNAQLLQELSNFLQVILNENSENEEEIQNIIQLMIDSQLISKLFEIFTSQSREYQFLKQLIIIIFSNANHFQIEHFFDTKLKYFIMNHLINCFTSTNQTFILQVLQFIHQILFEEKEYNQQGYYPRKKIIASLDLQAFINDFISSDNRSICNEALLIQRYL